MSDSLIPPLQQLLQDLQALEQTLPEALRTARTAAHQLRGLALDTQRVQGAAALHQHLRDWAGSHPVQGWIEASDAVHEVARGDALPTVTGTVLSADLARPDAALRVRAADHGWTVTTLRETDPGAPGTQPVLVRAVTHAGIRGTGDTLRYRLAQTLVDGTLRPLDAWFIGFGPAA